MECKEICGSCPWGIDIDPFVPWLYDKLALQDAGCPIGRHELDNEQWHLLSAFKVERDKWNTSKAKLRRLQEGMSNPLDGD